MSCRDTAGHFGFMDLEGFEPLTSRMRTERSPIDKMICDAVSLPLFGEFVKEFCEAAKGSR